MKNPFRKHGELTHVTQHLLVTLTIYLLSLLLVPYRPENLLAMIISTYAIDLIDHILAFILFYNRYPEFYHPILRHLLRFQIRKAVLHATKGHKVIDGLILHNFFVYLLVIVSLVVLYITTRFDALFFVMLGFFSHMSFDIFDDMYQIGHVKHWIPFRKKLRSRVQKR